MQNFWWAFFLSILLSHTNFRRFLDFLTIFFGIFWQVGQNCCFPSIFRFWVKIYIFVNI